MANFRNPAPMGDPASILGNPWKPTASLFGNSSAPFGLPAETPLSWGLVANDPCTLSVLVPLMPPNDVRTDAKLCSLSPMGYKFIYAHEAWKGVSNHLHWPGGSSGITLGPGYDMGARSASDITADMKSIGLSDDAAKTVSQAAGMVVKKGGTYTNADMLKFVKDHHKDVDLNPDQELKLLHHIVPHYEQIVRRSLKVPLAQHEFDALVSFAYNSAGRWSHVTRLLNGGKAAEAMKVIKAGNTTGGKVSKGLTHRRADEVKLFMLGKYEMNGQPIS
ncbi:glycoside hydrolase family protein [Dyella mobilis]|uniref:Lysozyme n=1 Tax=Dyella mobilis TaxID=1849582 RepID=A0ABS2KI42_9GAMM|nr:glycoside hydrolase family protein [Dyella mobilis]MBM7130715.1 glycoside hydrolase family protein [Dyella mobilis]GLQ97338.1 hypothetical protein GCM10007863_17580 [Dyella mobilis]